jgi:Flp pilus assembly protein TadB
MMLYVAAALVVLLVVRGVVAGLGLPAWALPTAAVAMALGLPVVLRSAWAHYRDRRAASDVPIAGG